MYFFQFLGDRLSDKQLIQRLRSLPGSGDSSAHAEALSGWGDMQTIFQQFGRAYLNDELADVNGDQIPFDPDHGSVTVVDSSGFGALAPPFVLHRERIEFPDGKAFDVEATPGDDPPGRYAVKPQPDGDWRRFPPRVPSPCAESDEYQLLLTSATGGGGSHQLDVKLDEAGDGGAEPAQVDTCLTGKWRAVPESLEDSMSFMAGGVAGFERLEVEAENWVCFDAAGFIEGYADMRARWRFELPGRASRRMQSEVTIRGPFSGRYRVEDSAIELSGQSNAVTADSRIWLDGEYVGEGGTAAMLDPAGGAQAPDNQSYRCDGDRLDWTPPVPGMRPEPVVYERVSP